ISLELINSLNLKEFFVPMSLEVGRSIKGFEPTSSHNRMKSCTAAKIVRQDTLRPPAGFAHYIAHPVQLKGLSP
ncbi:hypothetical protein, partial [Pseudomonas monteilii]|uniref:hypothetical protein n=1 Tax=Pseudomonas monteilii TaxID=76759 RepID=UPI001E60E895